MASAIEYIELIEFSGEENEVTFFGDVTTGETGNDAGEYWGAKYPSTIQKHDVVEVIDWHRHLYSLTENDTIEQYLNANREKIENAIIFENAKNNDY